MRPFQDVEEQVVLGDIGRGKDRRAVHGEEFHGRRSVACEIAVAPSEREIQRAGLPSPSQTAIRVAKVRWRGISPAILSKVV